LLKINFKFIILLKLEFEEMIEHVPKYKAKKIRMPYLIDLVEDKVRSRIIYPIIILIFFIFIIFLVIKPPTIVSD